MLKKGVYRTKVPGLSVEEHGGAKIKHYSYWYLCFYLPAKNVGFYGSTSPDYFHPYLQNTIPLQGELLSDIGNVISFSVTSGTPHATIIFNGIITGDELHLRYYNEDRPEEVFEDVFQYIDLGIAMENDDNR